MVDGWMPREDDGVDSELTKVGERIGDEARDEISYPCCGKVTMNEGDYVKKGDDQRDASNSMVQLRETYRAEA